MEGACIGGKWEIVLNLLLPIDRGKHVYIIVKLKLEKVSKAELSSVPRVLHLDAWPCSASGLIAQQIGFLRVLVVFYELLGHQ